MDVRANTANVEELTEPGDGVCITPILSGQVLGHWDVAGPMLERVLNRLDSGMGPADVLTLLQTREMQLWCVGDWQAAAVTRIGVKPQWSALTIVYLAGDGMEEWFDELLYVLESFARDWGCKYVDMHGRKGWRKFAPDRGYKEAAIMLRKEL